MKRYKYRKVTPEMLKEMRELYATGNYTQTGIAKMFGLPQSSGNYWLNPKSREKAKARGREYARNNPKKCEYNEARRDYQRERYQNDEEFRKRMIKHVTRYNNSIIEKKREYGRQYYHRNKFVKLMNELGIKRYI